MPPPATIAARLVLPAALLVVLGGCASDSAPAPQRASDGPTVIQPGGPGEPATTGSADAVDRSQEWNHTDVAFMQMMIPHHTQALEMSQLAARHADDERVRSIADRIRGAQAPEIQAMSAWLEERKMEVPRPGEDPRKFDHSRHGHHAMMGMMTRSQMSQLASARGREFDRLFLQSMIRHHAGAVDMAEDAAQHGVDVLVSEMVADVSASQSAEIGRMQEVLAQL